MKPAKKIPSVSVAAVISVRTVLDQSGHVMFGGYIRDISGTWSLGTILSSYRICKVELTSGLVGQTCCGPTAEEMVTKAANNSNPFLPCTKKNSFTVNIAHLSAFIAQSSGCSLHYHVHTVINQGIFHSAENSTLNEPTTSGAPFEMNQYFCQNSNKGTRVYRGSYA